MMRYYAIKWGNNTRISGKVGSIAAACHYCYGIVAENMQYVDLGTRKDGVRKQIAGLTRPEIWALIPESELSGLELRMRKSRLEEERNSE